MSDKCINADIRMAFRYPDDAFSAVLFFLNLIILSACACKTDIYFWYGYGVWIVRMHVTQSLHR